MTRSECVLAFGEGSNFQLVRWPQMEIQGIFKQKEQFDPNFCWKLCRLWSCQFIHTRGLKIAIQEIPELKYKDFSEEKAWRKRHTDWKSVLVFGGQDQAELHTYYYVWIQCWVERLCTLSTRGRWILYAIDPGLRDSASTFSTRGREISTRDFTLHTPDLNELHFFY